MDEPEVELTVDEGQEGRRTYWCLVGVITLHAEHETDGNAWTGVVDLDGKEYQAFKDDFEDLT